MAGMLKSLAKQYALSTSQQPSFSPKILELVIDPQPTNRVAYTICL